MHHATYRSTQFERKIASTRWRRNSACNNGHTAAQTRRNVIIALYRCFRKKKSKYKYTISCPIFIVALYVNDNFVAIKLVVESRFKLIFDA